MNWRSKRREGGTELAPWVGLRNEMDRLFDSFIREPFGRMEMFGGEWMPAVDVHEDETHVTVKAELPGLKADDIQLSVTGNLLTIAGEKRETTESNDGGCYRQERHFGSFRREISLPAPVASDQVDAEYRDGVLKIRLAKSAEAVARKIPVRTS
jgi:HSP20 family protein